MQTAVIIAERFLRFQNCRIISSAIMNVILHSFLVQRVAAVEKIIP